MTKIKMMLCVIGVLLILTAIGLGIYLPIYVMLYGGIMQIIHNWDINTSKVVWGFVKAILFETGIFPALAIGVIGVTSITIGVSD